MQRFSFPWLHSAKVDVPFILLPPFLVLLCLLFLPEALIHQQEQISLWTWVFLVMLVDVGHVYSTVFRTYFDSTTFKEKRSILILIPFLCWVSGVLLYSFGADVYWRCLAYLAVFHFVRQQYGFMRLYARNDASGNFSKWMDTIMIYACTIFPLLHWHFRGPHFFNWFVSGDFIYLEGESLLLLFYVLFLIISIVFVAKELWLFRNGNKLNIPKLAIISGTFISWYFGIVYFNSDLAFTALNVISHGVPYMALIWIYGEKKSRSNASTLFAFVFKKSFGWIFFLLIIFSMAYLEEGLWNGLVWHEYDQIFPWISTFSPSDDFLLLLVPLLTLPQMTHYVIDGFIWKVKKDEYKWAEIVLDHSRT
jgi:heme/copper-type cytochrome/quinol oxidase subunit 4